MQILAETDTGWIGFEGNELTIGSKVDDPPKLRLTAPCTDHGGGGGVVSFNFSRNAGICDGHNQTEVGMIRVEQAEDVRGNSGNTKAELSFMLGDGSGIGDVQKPFAFVWNAITRFLIGVLGGPSDTIWAPSGLYFTQQQADGNFVSYQVDRPFDKSATPVALWSAWTGKL